MNKKIVIVLSLIGVAIVASGFLIKQSTSENAATRESSTVSATTPAVESETNPASSKEVTTLATQWRWQSTEQAKKKAELSTGSETLLFTPQSVHDALQAVKVDQNGDIILDHDALISLDEALERIYNRLDGESLLDLQDLIENALPGKVGQQTAKLVGDYQSFLQAKEEFSLIHESAGRPYSEPTVASIQSDQALYDELKSLRELHLGRDTAGSLFEVSDANAEYFFDSLLLETDSSLTPEQKAQRRQEIQARLNELTGNAAEVN